MASPISGSSSPTFRIELARSTSSPDIRSLRESAAIADIGSRSPRALAALSPREPRDYVLERARSSPTLMLAMRAHKRSDTPHPARSLQKRASHIQPMQ